MSGNPLWESDLEGLRLIKRGKVRDIYEVDDQLLIVASDRISAFDVVMGDPIPNKGQVLTKISTFWFEKTKEIVDNHLITTDVARFPEPCLRHAKTLEGRSMLVKKARPLPVECIVRGYLSGSGWAEYRNEGRVCGLALPEGLVESQELPNPIFTPSTKAEQGIHDENISFEKAVEILGKETAQQARDLSLRIYAHGRQLAARKGIIIADTKFEFGYVEGRLVLIDEVLTPDSSRFWPEEDYRPGAAQKSFDKQFLRDYLNGLSWGKQPPPPKLPAEIVQKTRQRYIEALERLTGQGLK